MKLVTMKTLGIVVVCLAVGFGTGFKASLVCEHNHLEHNKQLLRRIHKQVWSNPDTKAALKAADELYTPDFVLHDWTGDTQGLENQKRGIADNRSISPDWNEEVLDMVAEGDMVVSRFLSTGTMKRDIPAVPGYPPLLPATCKFIRFPELAVHRIVNGKVAEQWDFADIWGANVKAGLIDPDKMTFKPVSACR
jgi:predicted ester cyclase